ncbi:MAG TPA: RNA polymerase sigma factor [Pirellulales bacterium]|nr:RNA polymerase sigma factor [Pirellulales bacterium]
MRLMLLTMSDSPASASAASSGIRRTAPAEDETALLAQAKVGSSSAFDQIITIHQEKIARLVQRLLGWQSDVDDIVQDVFVDALKNLPRFDGRSSVLTWLTRLAINRCRSHQRRQWLRRHLPFAPFSRDAQAAGAERASAITGSSSNAEHEIITAETIAQVHAAIKKLNQRDREIIVLRYLEELPIEQIAQTLKRTRGAVDVRLNRARRRLEELLKPYIEQ